MSTHFSCIYVSKVTSSGNNSPFNRLETLTVANSVESAGSFSATKLRASQAHDFCFVSGRDFSRAVQGQIRLELKCLGENSRIWELRRAHCRSLHCATLRSG